MQRKEESGMTGNFPVGETTQRVVPPPNITERSKEVEEGGEKGKVLSSVFSC